MRAKNDFHQSLRLSMGKNSIPWLYTITPSTVACMIDLTRRTSMEFKWFPLIMALLNVLSMSVAKTNKIAPAIRVHLFLLLKSLTNCKGKKRVQKSLVQSRSIILGSPDVKRDLVELGIKLDVCLWAYFFFECPNIYSCHLDDWKGTGQVQVEELKKTSVIYLSLSTVKG